MAYINTQLRLRALATACAHVVRPPCESGVAHRVRCTRSLARLLAALFAPRLSMSWRACVYRTIAPGTGVYGGVRTAAAAWVTCLYGECVVYYK